jgi:hypothetical protein
MREVSTIHQFRTDPKYGLSKTRTVIRCDDGSVYEFVEAEGNPRPRFMRSFDPDGTMRNTGTRKRMAQGVKETVNTLFDGWDK